MLLFHRPTSADTTRFLERQSCLAFTYSPAGATRTGALPGYTTDRNRILLGSGERMFERACEAVRRWQMFDFPWLTLAPRDAAVATGTTVAIIVGIAGVWTVSACRVVYVIDDDPRRYGFAYGTLPDHMESGEERFSVEWRDDDSVWYDILACSRPRHPLARLGKPVARLYQRRFARDSMRAMTRAVR